MRKQLGLFCAVLTAVGMLQSIGSAGIIILDSSPTELTSLLQSGAKIQVEDKEFTKFAYTPSGDMPPASAVQVYKIKDDVTGHVGIRFQALFKDLADPTDAGSDAIIQFEVEAKDPSQLISDVHLFANVNHSTNARALSFGEVVEDVFPGNSMSSFHIAVDENTRAAWAYLSDEGYAPQRSLRIIKDIGLFSKYVQGVSEPGDRVTISVIDQLFSQVPEPGSFGMLLAMVFGIFGYARKR